MLGGNCSAARATAENGQGGRMDRTCEAAYGGTEDPAVSGTAAAWSGAQFTRWLHALHYRDLYRQKLAYVRGYLGATGADQLAEYDTRAAQVHTPTHPLHPYTPTLTRYTLLHPTAHSLSLNLRTMLVLGAGRFRFPRSDSRRRTVLRRGRQRPVRRVRSLQQAGHRGGRRLQPPVHDSEFGVWEMWLVLEVRVSHNTAPLQGRCRVTTHTPSPSNPSC